jgi:hypothetical protein
MSLEDPMKRSLLWTGLGAVTLLASSSLHPALADVIDGNWCSDDGRHLSITGPTIVTPGGTRMEGAYTRHSFVYTAPANELGAGQEVQMRLLNETTVQIHSGPPDEGPTRIWHRCAGVTS